MNSKRNKLVKTVISLLFFASISTTLLSAPNYGTIAQYVANLIQNNHYSRTDFEDEVSEKFLESYLKFLDSNKLYFNQKDIDSFNKKYKTTLDDYIFEGSIQPATDIYNLYVERVTKRVEKIKEILNTKEFKFDSDRTVEKRRKDSDWAADEQVCDQLWENILEGQLLEEEIRKRRQTERAKELGKKLEDILGDDSKESPKEKILNRYTRFMETLDKNDKEEACNFFLSTLSQVYDPHSEYFSQSELENFQVNMQNKLVGIGALLQMDDGAAKIQGLVVGGPADRGGELQIGDRIVGVSQGKDNEMVDILYMKLNRVVDMIRGEKNTTVILKVVPTDAPDETKLISIVRDEVKLKDKAANAELIEVMGDDGVATKIGWINLYAFYADMQRGTVSCSFDVKRLLERLKKEKIESLVIDLRGNGGGSLEEAIRLTGLFIDGGPVVQAKSAKGRITNKKSKVPNAIYDGPLVVLTDRSSASASEIFAAALQDYGRAIVVGDKSTFGKGTVQTVMPVRNYMPAIFPKDTKDRAGALKVTIQKFYRIAGGSTQLKGVVPDIILPSYRDALETGEESLPNALEHDSIAKMKYESLDLQETRQQLLKLSEQRVKSDKEFNYIIEDNKRYKEINDRNEVSLNIEKRLEENKKEKERRKTRNVNRKKLFEEIEKKEKGKFKVTRLTLDNVDKNEIEPTDNFKRPEDESMRRAKDKEKELEEETPDFPHFLSPTKREALEIAEDLIRVSKIKTADSGS
ncbi:MAG: carboxy terminal-processing peptidase [Verrucomicrobiota bacterium]|nr:carboxy terminal-processing peptidase [Verrucomicrobiota bacterium]